MYQLFAENGVQESKVKSLTYISKILISNCIAIWWKTKQKTLIGGIQVMATVAFAQVQRKVEMIIIFVGVVFTKDLGKSFQKQAFEWLGYGIDLDSKQ